MTHVYESHQNTNEVNAMKSMQSHQVTMMMSLQNHQVTMTIPLEGTSHCNNVIKSPWQLQIHQDAKSPCRCHYKVTKSL